MSCDSLCSICSGNASPIATRALPRSAISACSAAPVPLPPQPTRPIRSESPAPAYALSAMSICEAAETAAAVVAAFIRKIRRVDFESCISQGLRRKVPDAGDGSNLSGILTGPPAFDKSFSARDCAEFESG